MDTLPRSVVGSDDANARDSRVNEIIAEYLAAVDAGRAPDRAELLARNPEFAAELSDCLADLDAMGRLAEPLQAPSGSAGDAATPFGEPPTLPWTQLENSTDDATGGRFGDYELIGEIGRGGMGVVYKARQVSLNRVVALKMILAGQWADQEEIRRFLEEAVNAAAAQHPNIITIHEIGQIAGQIYFTMEYVDGPNLAALVRESLPPPRDAARLIQTIADAVHSAHQRGVLHRDLKPSNILLQGNRTEGNEGNEGGGQKTPEHIGNHITKNLSLSSFPFVQGMRPIVTDFGLAKRIEAGSDLTGSGQILGTPSYMPPEQAAAKRGEVGPGSDVYSLGAILYELVTGRPPFRAESPLDTLVQVLESEPVAPRLLNRSVPRDLETICLKCLSKQPQRRYGSAAALAADLGRLLNEEPILARPVGTHARVWRWCKRRPGWATTIGVSVLALLLITAGSLWFGGRLRLELARTEEKQRELQIAMARQVAERLDSDLRQLAAVPRTLAVMLAERSDWTESQLDDALRKLLDSDPRLFGMCLALEPNQFEPGRDNFARYIFRSTGGVQLKYLHRPDYRPYREWDWYRVPQSEGRGAWTEPYIDRGGGEVPMVTYSEPIRRGGQFIGVVTADLSLAYFLQLKRWLDELQLSRGDYGFVVSRTGTLISDANPEYQMGRRIDEFAGPHADSAFRELLDLIHRHEPGLVRGIDLWNGFPVRYLVAPVPSTGWSFVAVIPEPPSLSPVSHVAR